jgi:hypothetical protein
LAVLEALIHEGEVGCVVEGLVPILLRVGDAEAELVGDGPGDVVSQDVELLLDGRQRLRERRRRGNRGQRVLLGTCDAGEEEEEAEKLKQHGEAQGDAPAPPLEPERLGIAHSEAGEDLAPSGSSKRGGRLAGRGWKRKACEEMRKRRLVSPIYIWLRVCMRVCMRSGVRVGKIVGDGDDD